jgi:hypothetical protein
MTDLDLVFRKGILLGDMSNAQVVTSLSLEKTYHRYDRKTR